MFANAGRVFSALVGSLLLFGAGINSASAGVILSTVACNPAHVTAGAPINANATQCMGLYDKINPGEGPNDDVTFLNNPLSITGGWATGAFGITDWVELGKDEHTSGGFYDVVSGDPATWSVTSPLQNQAYLIAAKQGNLLGLYYFPTLQGVTGGTIDMNAIFGEGITDDGWSHSTLYTSSSSIPFIPVPEPGALGLMGLGLLGLGLSRRRMRG